MNLSKSKYCAYIECPRRCWLDVYKKEEGVVDAQTQHHLDEGNRLGDLAMGYFGDFVEVTTKKEEDGSLDYAEMIRKTEECLKAGTKNICEASFGYGNLFCSVDILHKENDGYAIYEVKSSRTIKTINYHDVAFQKYVLQHCGINVTGVYIVHLREGYWRDGEIDLQQLFIAEDVEEKIAKKFDEVATSSAAACALINSKAEPKLEFKSCCNGCRYWDYCTKGLLHPQSTLNLWGRFGKGANPKWKCYNEGLTTFQGLKDNGVPLKDFQQIQVDSTLSGKLHIDKAAIRAFLTTMPLPLYFLDFETMQYGIPPFDRTYANQQIPFQYSLHVVESIDKEPRHEGFLAESDGGDPRRAIAEWLCKHIPKDVCTVAYNMEFERGVLLDLAKVFPDLSEHLLSIRDNMVDLMVPFDRAYYYDPAMGGSYSIKHVLPAVCPDDPKLDYSKLNGVHNGSEAMTIFPKIKDMTPEDREKARHQLLDYCGLDTYAMVRIWQELARVSK